MKLSYNAREIIKNSVAIILTVAIGYIYISLPFYKYLPPGWYFLLWIIGLVILSGVFGGLMANLGNRIQGIEGEQDVEETLNDLPYAIITTLRDVLKRDFPIQPVVAFSDPEAELYFGLKPIQGVYVIGINWLNKLIKKITVQHLNQNEINLIADKLEVYKS